MDIGELWTGFQEVRAEVGLMREKWDVPELPPRHWLQVMAREMGQTGDAELEEEDPDLRFLAIRMVAIGFCFLIDIKREEGKNRHTERAERKERGHDAF